MHENHCWTLSTYNTIQNIRWQTSHYTWKTSEGIVMHKTNLGSIHKFEWICDHCICVRVLQYNSPMQKAINKNLCMERLNWRKMSCDVFQRISLVSLILWQTQVVIFLHDIYLGSVHQNLCIYIWSFHMCVRALNYISTGKKAIN